MFSSCKYDPTAFTGNPPCDNTTTTCTVQLDFSLTDYGECPLIPFSKRPPFATPYNYTTMPGFSSGNFGNDNNPNSYACDMIAENALPAINPNLPCSGGASTVSYWTNSGTNQQQGVTIYQNYNTQLTVEYADACQACFADNNGNPHNARPVFTAVIPVPMGQGQVPIIAQQFTQYYYLGCQ